MTATTTRQSQKALMAPKKPCMSALYRSVLLGIPWARSRKPTAMQPPQPPPPPPHTHRTGERNKFMLAVAPWIICTILSCARIRAKTRRPHASLTSAKVCPVCTHAHCISAALLPFNAQTAEYCETSVPMHCGLSKQGIAPFPLEHVLAVKLVQIDQFHMQLRVICMHFLDGFGDRGADMTLVHIEPLPIHSARACRGTTVPLLLARPSTARTASARHSRFPSTRKCPNPSSSSTGSSLRNSTDLSSLRGLPNDAPFSADHRRCHVMVSLPLRGARPSPRPSEPASGG